MSVCPECEAEISLENPMRGEVLSCPDCGVELEVISVNPITLELAPMLEEGFGE